MTDDVWPVEVIPDDDAVHYRIHRSLLVDGKVRANCFREHGNHDDVARPRSMSTDWSRYSNPEDSRARAARPFDNLVVALRAGSVRDIPDVDVRHSPLFDNRAHTDFLGLGRDPEIRDRLREIAEIVLPL